MKWSHPEVIAQLELLEAALTVLLRWAHGESVSRFRLEHARGNCYAVRETTYTSYADFAQYAADAATHVDFGVTGLYVSDAEDAHATTTKAIAHAIADIVFVAKNYADIIPSVRADLKLIASVPPKQYWQDDRAVPADFFGPLWADEEPEWSREGWAKLKAYREEKAKLILPPPELFEREPDGIGPLSPELRASLADAKWIDDELLAGRLREYAGTNIAVIDRQVVGTGDSQLGLVYDTAERLGVPPCRVAVSYVG